MTPITSRELVLTLHVHSAAMYHQLIIRVNFTQVEWNSGKSGEYCSHSISERKKYVRGRNSSTHSPTGHCQCTIKNHLKQINVNMSRRNEFYRIRIYAINRSSDVINHPRRLKFGLTFKLRSNSQSCENKFMSVNG